MASSVERAGKPLPSGQWLRGSRCFRLHPGAECSGTAYVHPANSQPQTSQPTGPPELPEPAAFGPSVGTTKQPLFGLP
jgi:hypothetical protein